MPAFFSSVFGTILDGVNPYLKTYTFGDALAGCVIQTERARKAASGPGQPVRLRGKLFDTAWDLYALSIAIGMMHDCQIDSEDMVPEGYDQEPRYIPRNMLGHVQNEAMLEFMFQTALITTKHLALDEDRRLELAFGDGVKPDFSPAAFLTRFANYGLTKLHELISDTDNTETMEAFMSCLNDTYEAGVGSIEASDDLEDI